MSVTSVKGIVLKYVNMNDNDRLFTIFCPELGKVSAMSKGIRSHKHKDFAALQPFCYSEFVIDTSKGLGYINSATVIETFYDIRSGVEKMSLASYVADLVANMADEIMYDDEFFSFILNTMFMIAKSKDTEQRTVLDELLRLKAVFELKCVCVAGYMPQCDICNVCGCNGDLEYFDIYEGYAYCKDCAESGAGYDTVKANPGVIKMILFICQSDYRSVFRFNASEENIKTVGDISEKYLINKLELVSGALEYFKNIIAL